MATSLALVLGYLAGITLWVYSAWRVSRDERLNPQARQIGSLAVFFAPPLALLYWLSQLGGNMPFWIAEDADPDQDPPAA